MTTCIGNMDDVIDSRDVIARIAELESDRNDWMDSNDQHADAWDVSNPDEAAELSALKSLADEAAGYAADWNYGETLIRDSYFQTYAEELADDIGAVPDGLSWPMTCIDWEQAARELQMDYTSVDFDGVTYWIR